MVLRAPLAFSPAISPDGSVVAYLSACGPWGIPIRGGDAQSFRTGDGYPRWVLRFSPDGKRLVVDQEQQLTFLSTEGGDLGTIDLKQTSLKGTYFSGWSPDGSWVALCGKIHGGVRVGTLDLATMRVKTIFETDRPEGSEFQCPFRRTDASVVGRA